jgi:hypothetical protein
VTILSQRKSRAQGCRMARGLRPECGCGILSQAFSKSDVGFLRSDCGKGARCGGSVTGFYPGGASERVDPSRPFAPEGHRKVAGGVSHRTSVPNGIPVPEGRRNGRSDGKIARPGKRSGRDPRPFSGGPAGTPWVRIFDPVAPATGYPLKPLPGQIRGTQKSEVATVRSNLAPAAASPLVSGLWPLVTDHSALLGAWRAIPCKRPAKSPTA